MADYTPPLGNSVDIELDIAAYFIPDPVAIVFSFADLIPTAVPNKISSIGLPWDSSIKYTDVNQISSWQAAAFADSQSKAVWGKGVAKLTSFTLPWGMAVPADNYSSVVYQDASVSISDDTVAPWGKASVADSERTAFKWEQATVVPEMSHDLVWSLTFAKDSTVNTGWNLVNLTHSPRAENLYLWSHPIIFSFEASISYTPPAGNAVTINLGSAIGKITIPVDAGFSSAWGRAAFADDRFSVPWGFGTKPFKDRDTTIDYTQDLPPLNPPDPPEQPNFLRSYLLMNSVSVFALPSMTPISLQNISISSDLDSFVWSLSATIKGRTNLNLIKPDENGYREVEININGWQWKFLIRSYRATERLADETWTLVGSSRQILLSAPFSATRSQDFPNNILTGQIINGELFNTGFTAEYTEGYLQLRTSPSWTIAANSWGYEDKTPMEVIRLIAQATGAIIVPHRTEDKINIQPRYRVNPWDWDFIVDDAFTNIMPESVIHEVGSEWRPSVEYNSVIASGINHGLTVKVRRDGTDGNPQLPDIDNDLFQNVSGAREAGRMALSASGNSEQKTFNTLLFPPNSAPELAQVGGMFKVVDGLGGEYRGLCMSVTISASGMSNVTQTITLERNYRG